MKKNKRCHYTYHEKTLIAAQIIAVRKFVNIAHNPQEVGIENRKNDTRFKNKIDNNVDKKYFNLFYNFMSK